MTIRTAIKPDAVSLAAVSIEVWVGTYLRQGVSSHFASYALSEFTIARLEDRIADPAGFVLVSENKEGVDGYVYVTTRNSVPVKGLSGLEIATLYVQPRHHGKGIGKALLDAALRRCRTDGGRSVWLATNSENAPAIAFYLSQGFAKVGGTQFRICGQSYPNDIFSRDLNDA